MANILTIVGSFQESRGFSHERFNVLNWEDTLNNLVEDKIDEELIICCDVTVAKSFDSTEELLKWVKNNTDLKADNGDFKIEGQYLPVEI